VNFDQITADRLRQPASRVLWAWARIYRNFCDILVIQFC